VVLIERMIQQLQRCAVVLAFYRAYSWHQK